ncbi:hypothetical protein [Limnohabitans sp.]|uniref:hypothetical protein n=1 Tax=Limnohabitans sp. TaxID=1907725 RepID=UPI0033417870
MAPHDMPVPMDATGDLGENAGSRAVQEREATINQLVGMLRLLGVASPMEVLKTAGLAGVSLDGDKAKDAQELSHSDRLAKDTARLKQLADQQRVVRKQVDELAYVMQRHQAELTSLRTALASLEKDCSETAAACAPAVTKRTVDEAGASPAESIQVLETISSFLDDGTHMNNAYNAYIAQCEGTQTQPEPPALWISKAARAEIGKAKALLLKSLAEETAPKKRRVVVGGADARP